MALIRERFGYRDFALDGRARFKLTRWLYALCWAGDDRPSLLIDRATAWLSGNKILLPGIGTIERLVAQVRRRASRRAWRILAAALTHEQRLRIDACSMPNAARSPTTLEYLRATPIRRSPTELVRCLERLDAIRARTIRPSIPKDFPQHPYSAWPASGSARSRLSWRACPSRAGPPRSSPCSIPSRQRPRTTRSSCSRFSWPRSSGTPQRLTSKHGCARSVTWTSAALKLARGWRLLLQDTTPARGWRDHVFQSVHRPTSKRRWTRSRH